MYDSETEFDPLGDNERLPYRFFDLIFNQYLLMLGEFEILGDEGFEIYDRNAKNFILIMFFIATFMSQIVFFNVYIAVISQAYDARWENRDKYAL